MCGLGRSLDDPAVRAQIVNNAARIIVDNHKKYEMVGDMRVGLRLEDITALSFQVPFTNFTEQVAGNVSPTTLVSTDVLTVVANARKHDLLHPKHITNRPISSDLEAITTGGVALQAVVGTAAGS